MAHDRSLFYNHTFGRRFPIPLMALEAYALDSEAAQTDEDLFNVLVTTLSRHCKVSKPSEQDITYFLERLQGIKEEISNSPDGGVAKGKTFGSAYMDYVSGLPMDSALLKMVNYDISAADRLYCTIDRDDVVQLVKEYIQGKAEENLVRFEASMYGFGGSYSEDKPENKDKGVDISTPDGMAALKSLGF
ncbi:MAG: hypothetical protein DRR06_06005 [Gammaproteobacteria bacterium]|nr:MAG: hypothetical protein DRR06_06005 [Gammaproteobacteria bacterium]